MARDFDSEVTVYVWRQFGLSRKGHAALKLRGAFGDGYISWWPEDTDGGAFQGQQASAVPSYKRDMVNEIKPTTQDKLMAGDITPYDNQRLVPWQKDRLFGVVERYGQEADMKVKLPGRGSNGLAFGLDMAAMLEWWNVFRRTPHPRYKMVSKFTNCTGVAAAALKVGGAATFVKPPTGAFYIMADQIGEWALQLREEIDRRNVEARRLAVDIEEAGEKGPEMMPEIMSYADWMALSKARMGGATLRSDKIKKIDKLMKDYHAEAWDRANCDKKFRKLGDIMDTIHHYLVHKPGSKRGEAVITLGKQVLATAKYKAMEYRLDDAWTR